MGRLALTERTRPQYVCLSRHAFIILSNLFFFLAWYGESIRCTLVFICLFSKCILAWPRNYCSVPIWSETIGPVMSVRLSHFADGVSKIKIDQSICAPMYGWVWRRKIGIFVCVSNSLVFIPNQNYAMMSQVSSRCGNCRLGRGCRHLGREG